MDWLSNPQTSTSALLFRRRNKWALVYTNKRHLFYYVDVEGVIFKFWMGTFNYRLQYPSKFAPSADILLWHLLYFQLIFW